MEAKFQLKRLLHTSLDFQLRESFFEGCVES